MSKPNRRKEMTQVEAWIQSKLSAMSAAGLPVPSHLQTPKTQTNLPWQSNSASNGGNTEIKKAPVVYKPSTTSMPNSAPSSMYGVSSAVAPSSQSSSAVGRTAVPASSASYGSNYQYPTSGTQAYQSTGQQQSTLQTSSYDQTQPTGVYQSQNKMPTSFHPQNKAQTSIAQPRTNYLAQSKPQMTFVPKGQLQSVNQQQCQTPSTYQSQTTYPPPSNYQQAQQSSDVSAFNQPPPQKPVPVPAELKGAENLLKLPPPPPPSYLLPNPSLEEAPTQNTTYWSGVTGGGSFGEPVGQFAKSARGGTGMYNRIHFIFVVLFGACVSP